MIVLQEVLAAETLSSAPFGWAQAPSMSDRWLPAAFAPLTSPVMEDDDEDFEEDDDFAWDDEEDDELEEGEDEFGEADFDEFEEDDEDVLDDDDDDDDI